MKHTSSVLMRSARRLQYIAVVLFGSLTLTGPVYAYLDPGTGSIMIQIFLGGIAGLAVAGKLFWFRITDFLSNLFTRDGNREKETTILSSHEPNMDSERTYEHNDKKQ